MRKDNSELRDRDQRQASLIRQLEESVAQMSSTEASASVPYHRTSILNSDSGTSAEQEMLGMQQLLLGSQPEAETASSGQFPGPASHLSMLAIVQSQRDRFRDRSRELEEASLTERQPASAAVTTVSILTPSPAPPPPGVPEADYSLLERYSHAYEARLNPFRQFGEEERRRRYQALQLHEKLIHSLVRCPLTRLTLFGVSCPLVFSALL
ncbi:unnamed protein product [Schistocephalus solidus]|uniref:CASP C-terminal domain-containing protein n=1 Tax=Schistocephalus solidus TaxID=70667 RepID=A0A3P7EXX4_SCHSO|nr:unnamed protein product [Schistocephalus solidus]